MRSQRLGEILYCWQAVNCGRRLQAPFRLVSSGNRAGGRGQGWGRGGGVAETSDLIWKQRSGIKLIRSPTWTWRCRDYICWFNSGAVMRSALSRRVGSSIETRGSSQIEFSSPLNVESKQRIYFIYLFNFCSFRSFNVERCGCAARWNPVGNLRQPLGRSKGRNT